MTPQMYNYYTLPLLITFSYSQMCPGLGNKFRSNSTHRTWSLDPFTMGVAFPRHHS